MALIFDPYQQEMRISIAPSLPGLSMVSVFMSETVMSVLVYTVSGVFSISSVNKVGWLPSVYSLCQASLQVGLFITV